MRIARNADKDGLLQLYNTPNIVDVEPCRLRWVGPIVRMGEERSLFWALMSQLSRKKPVVERNDDGWTRGCSFSGF